MDFKLAIECYKDAEHNIKKLQLEKDILLECILNKANTKLDMNRTLAKFSEKDFEAHMNSMMNPCEISKVNRTTILGKNWVETDVIFDFYLKDLKYEIKLPIMFTNIENMNIHTLGQFELSIYVAENSTILIEYLDNLVELSKVLKGFIDLTFEELVVLATIKLQERQTKQEK